MINAKSALPLDDNQQLFKKQWSDKKIPRMIQYNFQLRFISVCSWVCIQFVIREFKKKMNHEFLLDKTDNVTDLRFAMTDHDSGIVRPVTDYKKSLYQLVCHLCLRINIWHFL